MSADRAPFSVLIPERGRPDLLGGTLAALAEARAGLGIEHRVRVLVNGAPAADYAALRRIHPDIEWSFSVSALGFHGAIAQLIASETHPWVYLLNSDMRVDVDALRQLLPWRAPDVFAIASQIEFADRTRRREETGYTLPVRGSEGQLELHDRLPPDASVRGHLYAGGGASLFQTAALRRYLARSHAYAPFYFEDADWAMQAWAEGLCVLHCPLSRAVHEHRATIGRYVPAATVAAIVARNLAHFRWRYGDLFGASRGSVGDHRRWFVREHRDARARVRASPIAASLAYVHQRRYPHAERWRPPLPRVLLLASSSPLPAITADARAAIDLVRASATDVDWVLLHGDAGEAAAADADDGLFREIHPIGAGATAPGQTEPVLRAAARQLIDAVRPALIVCADRACAALVDGLPAQKPAAWWLPDSNGGSVLLAELSARLARGQKLLQA